MIVYWPVGILEKSDSIFGDEQHTYESVTKWSEVEDCFRCWMFEHNMKFKKLLVEVCDLSLEIDDPNYRKIFEVNFEPKFSIGQEVKDENRDK